MSIPVIVMGAAGRMGSTIVRMARENAEFILVGVVEHEQRMGAVAQAGCLADSSPVPLLSRNPGATVIEFTAPAVSLATAKAVAEHGGRHVIGTTGFSEGQKAELAALAAAAPNFWSPIMSVGINALLRVLPELTRLLGGGYDMEVLEIHHNKKKDSPSGTALRLAECIADARQWPLAETACYHREGIIGERPSREIGLQTLRGGDVVGVHTVYYMGPGERVEINHQAHSRENFAAGALRAARWMQGKPAGRLYSMGDVLQ
jgi:4-hydroxy-tetrahydrodipicolinate reductase